MRSILRRSGKTMLSALLILTPIPAAAQLAISHDDIECWPSDRYPVLSVEISPPDEVRSVRIYFRSQDYPDFYFVDAVQGPEGTLEAVLPLAAPETTRVVYYIEALSQSFESGRTREWMPQVAESDECRRRDPLLALFQGDVPKIVVGAARAGAAALPPGFLSTGIVGAGAGGLGATAIVGIVAGGITGGVIVVGSGEDDPSSATTTAIASQPSTTTSPLTTSSVPPAVTTSTAPGSNPTTSTTSTGPTTSTTTTGPGTSTSTSTATPTTTTAPSTTTTTAPGNTTTSAAPTTSTTTSAPTTSTTSAPVTTTTSAPPGADVAVTLSAPASVGLTSPIRYQVIVRNNGPATASGVRVLVSIPVGLSFQSASLGSCTDTLASVQCNLGSMAAGGSSTIQITVLTLRIGTITATASVSANEPDPVPGNNSASASTRVRLLQRESSDGLVTLAARLEVPPAEGRDRGQIVVGTNQLGLDDTAGVEIQWNAEPGETLVEAVLAQASGRSGKWIFELRTSPGLEIRGVRVEAGEPISSDPRNLSFHVRGEAGERLRFRYVLGAPD